MSPAGPEAGGSGAVAAASPGRRRPRLRLDPLVRREWRTILAFVLPGFTVFAVFVVIPTGYTVALSFYRLESLIGRAQWVGLANYADALGDARFWSALLNGTVYAAGSVTLQVLLGLPIALLLNQRFRGQALVRGAALVPYVIPTVAVVFIWKWMLDENIGIVNYTMKLLGFPPISWFSAPAIAMLSTILVGVWAWTPFVTITFLAALQTVNEELYEAARVDGATVWQQLWYVIFPVLRPVLVIIVLLRTIWMFNKFDVIWLLTRGGPLRATEHLPILAYQKVFGLFEVGSGAAVATINFVFLLAAVAVYFRLFRLEDV
jgi:multiple sugar transport system permease protein